ncbi:hypothetical protein [Xenorhabdus innexi]|uniref:Major capsid protein n=1 Tax=Xenorhabdus innexi TaxID=290109 RepID=A0A1N6MWW2_9GAMM|nr:hypothetical protein [Xenorhabdus innexi]PHM35930.1 hypothetical protein Xinn_02000 [Xenorhabdus innexi]SIP73229.1 conserved hypothetical protein [Xenorhabdus innexi]
MRQMGVVPAASGYPNYSFLTNPIIGKALIARFKMKGITAQITTSQAADIPKEISTTGNEVILRREPEAEIFDYQKNQPLTHSKLATDIFRMTIDRAKYWSLKVNYIDTRQIENINTWVNSWKDDAANKMDLSISREILIQTPWQVSPFNKGQCAGKRTGQYNLGTLGHPITVSATNIGEQLANGRAVLAEQGVSGPFIIVTPYALQPLMYQANSVLYDASKSGQAKSIVLMNGEVWPDMVGFTFVFTHESPTYIDPETGDRCYTVLFGRKDAILMITQINYNRVIDSDATDFATYWQGLQVYGFKLMRPEAMAVMYITLKK